MSKKAWRNKLTLEDAVHTRRERIECVVRYCRQYCAEASHVLCTHAPRVLVVIVRVQGNRIHEEWMEIGEEMSRVDGAAVVRRPELIDVGSSPTPLLSPVNSLDYVKTLQSYFPLFRDSMFSRFDYTKRTHTSCGVVVWTHCSTSVIVLQSRRQQKHAPPQKARSVKNIPKLCCTTAVF